MRTSQTLPIAMIGGAFRHPDYLWSETRHRHDACIVGSGINLLGDISSRAESILEEIKNLGSPVLLCGHSLGSLIAYQVAQIAPKGLVKGTALVCPGLIGGSYNNFDWEETIQLATNPFGAVRQILKMCPERPESIFSLLAAVFGDVPIGEKLKNVLVVNATEDAVTLPSQVRMVAKRVSGTLLEVAGGHDLPVTDTDGEVLKKIARHLRRHV